MSTLRNLGNLFTSFILRSPLHGLLSKNMLLITVTGRKSGKPYTTPVGYVRSGSDLLIVSSPDRTWWKNLRGGAPVRLRLHGKSVDATGLALEDCAAVMANLVRLLQAAPIYQKYLAVALTPEGQPSSPTALESAARTRVVVCISNLKV